MDHCKNEQTSCSPSLIRGAAAVTVVAAGACTAATTEEGSSGTFRTIQLCKGFHCSFPSSLGRLLQILLLLLPLHCLPQQLLLLLLLLPYLLQRHLLLLLLTVNTGSESGCAGSLYPVRTATMTMTTRTQIAIRPMRPPKRLRPRCRGVRREAAPAFFSCVAMRPTC